MAQPPRYPTPVEDYPTIPTPEPVEIPPVSIALPSRPEELDDLSYFMQSMLLTTEQLRAGSDLTGVQVTVQERYYRDHCDFYSSCFATAKRLEGDKYAADRQLEIAKLRQDSVNQTDLVVRQAEIQGRLQVAQVENDGRLAAATVGLEGDKYQADRRAEVDRFATQQQYAAALHGHDKDYQARIFSAQASKDASVLGTTKDYEGRVYSADRQYAASVYDADKQMEGIAHREAQETARLNRKLQYADDKFAIVYPVVQQSIEQAQSGTGVQTPGFSSDPPPIDATGVWTEGQVQQQVNRAIARNDARTQAQMAATERELAGRGFSSNSPLVGVIRAGYHGQNLRSNVEAEAGIRIEAARLNVESIREGQKARADQFARQQQAVLEGEKNQVTRQVGLVGALSQLIGSIT